MLVKTLAQQRHFHFARRIGMRLRSELTVEIFDKALRRKNTGGSTKADEEGPEESASVGKIITLVSEDTNRVLRMGCDSHLLYGSPLEIIVGLALLYKSVPLISFSISVWVDTDRSILQFDGLECFRRFLRPTLALSS
jgi:hypothetical protein